MIIKLSALSQRPISLSKTHQVLDNPVPHLIPITYKILSEKYGYSYLYFFCT